MILLDNDTQKLQAVLDGAVTTDQPEFQITYGRLDEESLEAYETNQGELNDTTDVDLVAGQTDKQLGIRSLSIFNRDTETVVVTIKKDVSGTDRLIYRGTLLENYTAHYESGRGWYTLDENGSEVMFIEKNDLTEAVVWDTVPDAFISESSVTQHEGAIDHNALLNYVAEEHIRWDLTGVEDVHDDRIAESSVTQHEAALTILESQISDLQDYLLATDDADITGQWDFEDDVRIRDGSQVDYFDESNVNRMTLSATNVGKDAGLINGAGGLEFLDIEGFTTGVRLLDGRSLSVLDASGADSITLSHDGTFAFVDMVGTSRLVFRGTNDYEFENAAGDLQYRFSISTTDILFESDLDILRWFFEDGDGNLYYTQNFNAATTEGFTIHRGNQLELRGSTGANKATVRHNNTDLLITGAGTAVDIVISGFSGRLKQDAETFAYLSELPVVNDALQARRTTNYELTTAFVDITFDTTDEETDAAVVEHNNTNTDDFDIKVAGVYLVAYGANIEVQTTANDTITADGRVRLDDSTIVPGSESSVGVFNDSSIDGEALNGLLGNVTIATLPVGKLTLQLQKTEIAGNGEQFDATKVKFVVQRLRD